MIKLMNLELKLDGGQISASDFEKMKNQYSNLLRLLDKNNSNKYGYPYTVGFMDAYNYYNTGYDQNDAFDLYKKLKDLQEYVWDKRNELRFE